MVIVGSLGCWVSVCRVLGSRMFRVWWILVCMLVWLMLKVRFIRLLFLLVCVLMFLM